MNHIKTTFNTLPSQSTTFKPNSNSVKCAFNTDDPGTVALVKMTYIL